MWQLPRALIALLVVLACGRTPHVRAQFDFETGNAAIEVVVAGLDDLIIADISPNVGDASLVVRLTAMVTNAWWEATAPYTPSGVGVYSDLGRRPPSEVTNANVNTALIYASYRVSLSLLPGRRAELRAQLEDVGLDPDDDSTDPTTAVGLGNLGGNAVVRGRLNDGMNQAGNFKGPPVRSRRFNAQPYADYTGYEPVNTAYRVRDAGRWQPDIQRQGTGIYKIQQFVTPQYALVEPYAFPDARKFRLQPPLDSNPQRRAAYKAQADEVLAASAALDDRQKVSAEYFDNKLRSLAGSTFTTAIVRGVPLLDFIYLECMVNMALFDAGIVVWQEKYRYDAVRPFTAIRELYGSNPVRAWGGPGEGTVRLPADEWASYLPAADHPEYPSATTCLCVAQAHVARRWFGTDELNFVAEFPAGSSRIEPGVTPAKDLAIEYATWTEFVEECGESRIWAGVHFRAAVDASLELCGKIGDQAWKYMRRLARGKAKPRPPSRGRAP